MATESPCVSQIKAIGARLDALEKMDDEREDRNKERFVAMREAVASALASADKALVKAETASEKRFESVNEFRQTLSDQATTLLPRSEYNVQHASLVDRSNITEGRINRIEAANLGKREGLSGVGSIVIGVISGLSLLVAFGALLVAYRH